ncbi:hypothetical protein D6833_10085 [Candidatus Parcubacteria bacterium]|nr:MAG: hypothetical protein D6833_10085 [Candidatus Parcubacteria bacterium]
MSKGAGEHERLVNILDSLLPKEEHPDRRLVRLTDGRLVACSSTPPPGGERGQAVIRVWRGHRTRETRIADVQVINGYHVADGRPVSSQEFVGWAHVVVTKRG